MISKHRFLNFLKPVAIFGARGLMYTPLYTTRISQQGLCLISFCHIKNGHVNFSVSPSPKNLKSWGSNLNLYPVDNTETLNLRTRSPEPRADSSPGPRADSSPEPRADSSPEQCSKINNRYVMGSGWWVWFPENLSPEDNRFLSRSSTLNP